MARMSARVVTVRVSIRVPRLKLIKRLFAAAAEQAGCHNGQASRARRNANQIQGHETARSGNSKMTIHDPYKKPKPRWQKRIELAFDLFVIMSVLNFVAFVVTTYFIGGDALSGLVENGHLYVYGSLGMGGPKTFHEVSYAVYTYSNYHAISLIITWPTMFVIGIIKVRLERPSRWRRRRR